MVISTRSKTGSRPAAAPAAAIAKKPTRIAAKKGIKAAVKAAKAAKAAGSSASASASAAADASPPAKTLPSMELLCDDGQRRTAASLLTDDTPGLILFTYPRANTGGCTAQAVGLSAFADEAATLGYALAGASYDSVKSQASWKAKKELKCRLFCDTLDAGFLKKLGAHKAPKGVKRGLFIIHRGEGKKEPSVVAAHVPISPKEAIATAQEYVRKHPCNNAKDDADMDGGDDDGDKDDEKDDDASDKEDAADDANGDKPDKDGAKDGAKGAKRQAGGKKGDDN